MGYTPGSRAASAAEPQSRLRSISVFDQMTPNLGHGSRDTRETRRADLRSGGHEAGAGVRLFGFVYGLVEDSNEEGAAATTDGVIPLRELVARDGV